MGMEETLTPGPNFNRPVKDLVYKDLLTSTFTQVSHDRGVTWTPTFEKQQLVRKGLLHRAKNHYQRRVVLIETVFWKCRQKSVRTWSGTTKLCLQKRIHWQNLFQVHQGSGRNNLYKVAQRVHEQVECFSCSCALR